MKKKIAIILAIVIPAIILSTLLLLNKEKIGIPSKDYITKTYKVEGISCESCAINIKNALNKKAIKDVIVDTEKKTATITYDKNTISQSKIKEIAYKEGFKFFNMGTDKLEVINYKIKMN